jgi:hypothetical protein
MTLRDRFQKGIFVAWHGNGMACVNRTRPHYVNQTGKTQSKALAERHGMGTAWERHGMCHTLLDCRHAAAIQQRVTAVLLSIANEAFADSFHKIYERCQPCVVKDDDYFEGQ